MNSLEREEPAWLELLTSLLEVRRVLVSEAVALAAERHTEDDLTAMREVAAEQAKNVGDPLAFARGDLALQRVVVRAARNVGFELILNSFARFPEEQPQLLAELYDRREESLPFYDVLVELVRAGDGEAARHALRTAFNAMDQEWLARHGHKSSVKADAKLRPKATTALGKVPAKASRATEIKKGKTR
jgi:DNA-binding FadR family transcriptional regulator